MTTQVSVRLEKAARVAGFDAYPSAFIAVCVAYKMMQTRIPLDSNLGLFLQTWKLSKDDRTAIKATLDKTWPTYVRLIAEATHDDLKAIIASGVMASRNAPITTPDTIRPIILHHLNITEHETFVDFGAGTGDMMVCVAKNTQASLVKGFEIDKTARLIAKLRFEAMGLDKKTILDGSDVFLQIREKFDAVYCHPPLGIRFSNTTVQKFLGSVETLPALARNIATDWLFAIRAVKILKDGGRAAVLVTNGAAFGQSERLARKFLLDNNFVEAVVALPGGMLDGTATPVDLVLLRRNDLRKAGGVAFVDATGLGHKEGRKIVLADDEVEEVCCCLDSPMDGSEKGKIPTRYVLREEIEGNNYNLYPCRYMGRDVSMIGEGVPLDGIAENIRRGVALPPSEQDALRSEVETPYRYISQAAIQDGGIDYAGTWIARIPSGKEKYCAEDGDLVVTKTGRPLKVAVVRKAHDERVLVGSNLYIVPIKDKAKINPYFVMAYLQSEMGQKSMERISVGDTIRTIAEDDLKALRIPIPAGNSSSDLQGAVERLYREKHGNVVNLRKTLNVALKELGKVYEDVTNNNTEE